MAHWIVINPLAAMLLIAVVIAICARRLRALAQTVEATLAIPLVERLDALLPQTQCGHCGYPGCKPYAQAIAGGDAFNKCLPGGDPTVRNLAHLLDMPVVALDAPQPPPLSYAFIREAECIGCTKCIQACPVDAIMGAAKLMHTVIRDECTGCDLCVEPCPVDCIEMRPYADLIASDRGYDAAEEQRLTKADHYRQRFEAHQTRIEHEQQQKTARRQQRLAAHTPPADTPSDTTSSTATDDKLAIIAAALARTQAKKSAQTAALDATDKVSADHISTDVDPGVRLQREIAAIDKRLVSTREKLALAQTENAGEKIAALQTALETLQQKRAATEQALQSGDRPS